MLSYWTLSDVFEEQGVIKQPFYGGYGLMAEGGVPKPAFNAFKLLHRLGSRRIATDSSSALVTRRDDGSWTLALWNLEQPEEHGASKDIEIRIKGWDDVAAPRFHASTPRMDRSCRLTRRWAVPSLPPPINCARCAAPGRSAPRRPGRSRRGRLVITIPPHGLALIEVR